MSIGTLILYIGINALILSAVVIFILKKSKTHWMTYVQTFCGALFLFSGWVKAVDPLGTAYKMEQYFDEFYYTFSETSFSFIAPLFPFLSEYSVGFSVFMIVFELVLAVNLLTGAYKKVTAWAFFLLTVFFTILTGFTYLTGYVPSGVNFFSFADWGPYKVSNMRVTDCGCFGDFIKLEPRTSFFKDLVLLVPAVLFIVLNGRMFQLFSPGVRRAITWVILAVSLVYCMSNFVWDIPHVDFRPFKEGADIRSQYSAEQEAAGNVKITGWKIKGPKSNEVIELSNDVFTAEWGQKYKPEGYEVIDQIKSMPSIPITKISDFEFVDAEGYPVSEDFLNDPGMTLMIVSYKMKGEYAERQVEMPDTTFVLDTVYFADRDSFYLEKKVDRIGSKTMKEGYYIWDDQFLKDYRQKIEPLSEAAAKDGVKTIGLLGGADAEKMAKFKADVGLNFPLYEADDILLKTIVRSNPGVVLWKDGKILKKWHIRQLPDWSEMKK